MFGFCSYGGASDIMNFCRRGAEDAENLIVVLPSLYILRVLCGSAARMLFVRRDNRLDVRALNPSDN